MKKILFLLFLSIFLFHRSFSQTSNSVETAHDGYCTYIKPSSSNVCKLLLVSRSEFENIMTQSSYKKTTNDRYIATSTKRSSFRVISKDSRTVMMFFGPNDVDLVSNFRNDIKNILKDVVVQYEDGYEVYRLLIPYDGLKYRVTFRLKDETTSQVIMGRSITTNMGTLIADIN